MTVLGLLKSGKQRFTTYDRSGRPVKICWRMVRKVRPDHEEILLDGTAQSVRYGETFVIDQGDLIISILKKWQDLKISFMSSWETMKQNWNCL